MTKSAPVKAKATGCLSLPFGEGVRLALNAVPDLAFDGDGFGAVSEGLLERHDHASTLSSRKPGRGIRTVSLEAGKGDWLDGFDAALEALAVGLDLSGAKPKAGCAVLVGHLMDRNEGDGLGDSLELERMLAALGVKKSSLWLSGKPCKSLEEAANADVVISLPHGRKAGRALAHRLKVRLIETELPFGLDRTRRFVELLGRELRKGKEAEAFIKTELDDVIPRLEWSVPHAFLNRKFAFAGDPHYGEAFAELIAELGGSMTGMVLTAGAHHLGKGASALKDAAGAVFAPEAAAVRAAWDAGFWKRTDLLVANTLLLDAVKPETGWLEFGYPSCLTHYLLEEPSLGFQGCLGFLSKAATETAKGFCAKVGAA
ncbi:MAG: nitrogenase component 1 [Elusimicrobiota bacterium]|jgi:nitrogenase molybdenum-iron protein alpha/beta subunit